MTSIPFRKPFEYRPGDVTRLLRAVIASGPELFDPNAGTTVTKAWTAIAVNLARETGRQDGPDAQAIRKKIDTMVERHLIYRRDRFLRPETTPSRVDPNFKLLDNLCIVRGDLCLGPGNRIQFTESISNLLRDTSMDTLYRNNSIGRHHKIQRELVENNRSSKDSCQSDKIRKGKVETIQNREDANSEQFIAFFGQATFKPKGYLPETITDIGRVAAILEEQRTRSTQEKNTHKLSNKLADGTNMSSQGSDGSRNLTDKDLGQDYDDKKITIGVEGLDQERTVNQIQHDIAMFSTYLPR